MPKRFEGLGVKNKTVMQSQNHVIGILLNDPWILFKFKEGIKFGCTKNINVVDINGSKDMPDDFCLAPRIANGQSGNISRIVRPFLIAVTKIEIGNRVIFLIEFF